MIGGTWPCATGRPAWKPGSHAIASPGNKRVIICIVACYTLALLVLTTDFAVFEKCPWQPDPATAIKRIVLVGLPACCNVNLVDSRK